MIEKNPSINESIQNGADATNRLALATEKLLISTRNRFIAAFSGLIVLILMVLFLGWYVQYRANENDANFRLIAAQNVCFQIVQGNYYVNIGLLADSNGRTLRGETADPAGNLARVRELRKASGYVGHLKEICYTDNPDSTPLDNQGPSGDVLSPVG